MNPAANRNQLWGRVLADELARAGVREVVLAPGSRSTPLVLAFAEHGGFRITVQVDERSAGFLALGIGRGSGHPAAVLTTSGTATAHLLAPVIEASQSEIPLLLLTADRPPRLRDADANQAIDQVRLFGGYVRAFHELALPGAGDPSLRHLRMLAGRAVADAVGLPAGPVHLNIPFEKPLEPTEVPGDLPPDFEERHPLAAIGRPGGAPFVRVERRALHPAPSDLERVRAALHRARRPLLAAGIAPDPGAMGPALAAFATRWGIPVLADPLSGVRWGYPEAPVAGSADLFLREGAATRALRPDLVLRVGASPTSAPVLGFLEELAEVPQILIDPGGRWKDHLAVASEAVRADPVALLWALAEGGPSRNASGAPEGVPEGETPGDQTGAALAPPGPLGEGGSWLELWMELDRATAEEGRSLLPDYPSEGVVLAAAAEALAGGGTLFVGSSMPVRDLDAFVPARPEPLIAHGNRGASGIDGLVSTALGLRMAAEAGASEGRGTPMIAVLGDLSFLHDLNGLLAVRNVRPDLVLVVIHNDGGGIFHHLPIRDHEPAFTPLFATPHGLDFAHAAAMYDLPYEEADLPGARVAIQRALARGGPCIVQVRSGREDNHRLRTALIAAVRARVRTWLAERDGLLFPPDPGTPPPLDPPTHPPTGSHAR